MSLTSLRSTKSSGYKWLADIPEQWDVEKFRYVFSESQEKIESPSEIKGEMLSVSGYRGIEVKEYEDESLKRKPNELINYRIVKPKQLVVNTMWLNYAGLGVSTYVGYVSPAYRSYAIRQDFDTRFIHHLMRSDIYVKGYTRLLTGIRPNSLQMGRDDLMAFPIVVPPREEQQKIAQFLDYETAKIDALIDEQKRLIELLKEKRQAVISHAVTKGLNPGAPMKDSGVEWLGEVPKHWLYGSLGYYSRIETGSTPDRSNPEYWGGDIPWIKTGEVNYQTIFNSEESITLLATKESSVRLAPPGTLLMAMYGQGVTRGRVAILGVHATFNQACAAITVNHKLEVEFLELYLKFAYSFIRDVGNETSQMNLNASYVAKIPIVVPPLEEQEKLITTVNKAILKLSSLETESKTLSETLKERRSALISAAVTGKIDVRDWQPPAGSDTVDSNASMQTERHYG
ncbi:restriction endonuclease subunit S [Pseudidiomarina terrestris]|uniref:restriction endonuclease subunit S n=1 Tax=Pseudidiomarina terrestris TaxID=2820060 RepID=UPI002656F47E|nr:restriction endonuclease subunit S [Pseudidiomarina sp. 1ASP75-5]MDN7135218.1 restriction endonuclease subunit S [Pseudidiomarina sp. 1ASP75-5]